MSLRASHTFSLTSWIMPSGSTSGIILADTWWTSTSGNGAYGNTGGTDYTWTQSGTGGACNVQHRYYCFQM